jgi:hypothetical protein
VVYNLIYIERTITIKKNQAKIKEPIVLYKGDMNIELQFTIENNPFKYKAGMDVTYGQLVIKRPTAEPIFSEPAKMSSSRVIFIVTGDMIDELTEIGVYDFQIQLLNTDMTSRGSLPPVIGGIDIREPLCEKAMVNRASVNDANTYVMRANDNIATFSLRDSDALFDEDGDYNRTNWYGGDIITDAKLNKIEEALYQINDDIPTDYATEKYVEDTNRETKSFVITNYTTRDYVDASLDLVAHDIEKELYNYASRDYVDNSISKIDLTDYAKEDYVAESITNNNRYIENVILNDYVTQDYVDDAMKNIEGIEGPMGPQGPQGEVGPQGPQGEPGKDADPVDLTGYATEDYVNDAIGDINAILDAINGEEV